MPLANDVWVVFPGKTGHLYRDERTLIRRECAAQGWNYQERPTATVPVHPSGRRREILLGSDASAIYRRAHRARVAFISFAKSHVFLHPLADEAIRKNAISRVQHYFRYKCFVELIAEHAACNAEWVKGFAARFAAATLNAGCENEFDPRCLPLHVFANDGTHDLFVEEGRGAFDRRHGAATLRQDLAERSWRLDPRAYHGHDILHIAGTALPKGFHWDVQPGGEKTLIATTTEAWVVSKYVNIYPDSHIRGDRPHALRVA